MAGTRFPFCAPAYGSSSVSMKKLQRTTILRPPGKRTAGIAILSVALFAVIVYSNSCGIRNPLITYIPMTGAIILYAIMLQMDSLLSQKSQRVSVLARLVKKKKVLPFTGIFLAGSLCSYSHLPRHQCPRGHLKIRRPSRPHLLTFSWKA